MALPASYLSTKIGYKKGMSLGLIIMAIGALVLFQRRKQEPIGFF